MSAVDGVCAKCGKASLLFPLAGEETATVCIPCGINRARQIKTRSVSYHEIARSAAFCAGFADARAGRPYRETYDNPPGAEWRDRTNWQWFYERGRYFALAAPDIERVKVARKVDPKIIRHPAWKVAI